MPRYFTHYWRNASVDAYVLQFGEDAPVDVVYGDDKLLGVQNGDYLYEVTVREGLLYLLGRLEVKTVGRRADNDPYPGETEADTQGYQAEAFLPMVLRPDNRVPLEITQQIECKTQGGIKKLAFTADGVLDRQTLRVVRELTTVSAALLDSVIEAYEESQLSAEDVQASNNDIESWSVEEGGFEGEKSTRLVNHYERNPRLRAAAIQIHGTTCQACGFSFEEVYGEHGVDYIEVHHKRPISSYGGSVHVNPLTDMAVLCSNCHRMIHRNPLAPLSVEDLRAMVAYTRYERTGNPYQ